MCFYIERHNDCAALINLYKDLPPSLVAITDLDMRVWFDISALHLKITDDTTSPPDISMSSDSLWYLMKYPWGRGTLMVNGRFSANYKMLWRFLRQTHIYYANNVGKQFPLSISIDEIVNQKSFITKLVEEYNETCT
jgi:hypothetical protein